MGPVTKRKPVSYDSMDFDGQTYVFIVFVTDFESRAGFIERVTLETEGGTLKVNYYELD